MHAVPIQMRAMIQITARTDTGKNKPARMTALGIHHASKLVCTLPSQSRDVWVGELGSPITHSSRQHPVRRSVLPELAETAPRRRIRTRSKPPAWALALFR